MTQMSGAIRRILVFVCVSIFPTLGVGATLHPVSDPAMGCFAELSGQIVDGDTDQVERAVAAHRETHADKYQYDGAHAMRRISRLCLSSPGGSLIEGVKLAAYLSANGIGTAVGRGKTCESACAVAFMGGTHQSESDIGALPDRILHPLGKLGFHSPSLDIPQGSYSEETVTRAYVIALKSVEEIQQIARDIRFPQSLVVALLNTPAQEMTYVTTVGQAAMWRIQIGPVVEIPELTSVATSYACYNTDAGLLDQATDEVYFQNAKLEASNGDVVGTLSDGFRQEAATGCEVTFGRRDEISVMPKGYVLLVDWVELFDYMFYPPAMLIADLAKTNDAIIERRVVGGGDVAVQFTGRCLVFKGTAATDNDPCVLARVQTRQSTGDKRVVDTFVWPSGAKTVVEVQSAPGSRERNKLNGVETPIDATYADSFAPIRQQIKAIGAQNGVDSELFACWVNPASGNRFCFLEVPQDGTAPKFLSGYR